MTNPYSNLADHGFWRRSVSDVEAHRFDPVVNPRFAISSDTRVATAGSCFAQHISRSLAASGCNYFVSEAGDALPETERTRRNFGVFSARYGNIYSTMQLNQLFDEAFGARRPDDHAWRRPDGRWVDPFRQQVEPAGFADPAEVAADRTNHLAAVRRMFEQCDLFVFTLGLTECWRALSDGSVYSSAPGVIAGDFDPARHTFDNLDVAICYAELAAFLTKLRACNADVRVLLTISPVPLIATAEDRSVVVATAYSKAVLRVVADMAWRAFDWVDYFPSYEIITGSQAHGRYYEDDAREVNRLGVAHAMRCFLANYLEGGTRDAPDAWPVPVSAGVSQVICDEEVLDSREAM